MAPASLALALLIPAPGQADLLADWFARHTAALEAQAHAALPPPGDTPATLTWTAPDGTVYTLAVVITGVTVTPPPQPEPPPPPPHPLGLELPQTVDFGTVAVGAVVRQVVTITNRGAATVRLDSDAPTGDAAFTRDPANMEIRTLAPGQSGSWAFLFRPTGAAGVRTGAAVWKATTHGNAPVVVPLTGTATGGTAADLILPLPGPQIRGYLDREGQPVRRFAHGEEYTLVGEQFGAAPGTVRIQGTACPVLAWSDTAIRVWAVGEGLVTVQTAPGQYVSQWVPPQ